MADYSLEKLTAVPHAIDTQVKHSKAMYRMIWNGLLKIRSDDVCICQISWTQPPQGAMSVDGWN